MVAANQTCAATKATTKAGPAMAKQSRANSNGTTVPLA